jgi:multidrug efflux pump subunit AcrA (membrane-fusion protein)
MTARVEVLVKVLDDVLSVPVGALVKYDKKYHVVVKKPDGGFDVREVKLGAANDKQVEVKEGLKPGEAVALDPLPLLSDEQRRKVTYPPQTKAD